MAINYEISDLTIKELNDKIDEIWDKIQKDPQYREWAKDKGIDVDQLKNFKREKAISIEKESQESGLAEIPIEIIVAFTPVVAKVVKDLWEEVIFPWLLKEMGHNKIKPKD